MFIYSNLKCCNYCTNEWRMKQEKVLQVNTKISIHIQNQGDCSISSAGASFITEFPIYYVWRVLVSCIRKYYLDAVSMKNLQAWIQRGGSGIQALDPINGRLLSKTRPLKLKKKFSVYFYLSPYFEPLDPSRL